MKALWIFFIQSNISINILFIFATIINTHNDKKNLIDCYSYR
ncbi:hypothetical protein J2W57_001939 [Chryseobacterium ginsenosidimutans]|uniref:Uncharacterized protein n=1 Tax=Chryseobacterium geocarposphaerae TaxID=1416776 RepID=A0ABU1LB37_9FLAO|nr:hypothetical protein [Chryseobacterium geocarposphaerae]MDR6698567.1 hypothetical protein [Chryseobacterium ginsenosidimutans]